MLLITLIVIRILGCHHLHCVLKLRSGWSSVFETQEELVWV